MKMGYHMKQVRERLAKGLVDKGILRTEKRNFLLFDMATHPVADGGAKNELRARVRALLTQRTVVLPSSPFLPDGVAFRYLRTVALVCAAYAANVLENAIENLGQDARERAFAQVDELLVQYSQWPFARGASGSSGSGGGAGSGSGGGGATAIGANLSQVIAEEVKAAPEQELQLEVRFFFSAFFFSLTTCSVASPRKNFSFRSPSLAS
jgi:Golgi phosphoprotein 3